MERAVPQFLGMSLVLDESLKPDQFLISYPAKYEVRYRSGRSDLTITNHALGNSYVVIATLADPDEVISVRRVY